MIRCRSNDLVLSLELKQCIAFGSFKEVRVARSAPIMAEARIDGWTLCRSWL